MENRYDLSGSLLHWYDYNKRLLPWRENKDPYRIWISEIMLQQTRVEAVKPYFDRFMEALPTVYDLAEVEDDRLMKLWEGLGYYNRARNLKAAAQTIVQEYGGQLPADYDKLLSLKGIGMYTAGAIGSIAFELQIPAVDGNVSDRERREEIAKLEKQMREASKMLEFEYAAVLRDRIIALRGEEKKK